MTLGVPRLREIINVAATVKTPSLLVHLQPAVSKDADAAKTVLNKLEFTTLAHVTERTEIYYDPTPEMTCVEEDREFMSFYFEIPDDDFSMENASPWMLRFVLDRKKKENKDLSNAEIAERINMDWNGDLKCQTHLPLSNLLCRRLLVFLSFLLTTTVLLDSFHCEL